jgi:WD40 repeat protein
MKRWLLILLVSLICRLQPLQADEPAAPEARIDFATQVMPLLQRNCTACHHAKKPEGGLVLESYDSLMKGGDSGAGAVAKDHVASLVWSRASGTEEPIMPPEDNAVGAKPLSPAELELLKSWITQGAAPSETSTASAIRWSPIATALQPIYAVAASSNGRFVAAGRGNQAIVYDLENGEELSRLIDPSLPTPAADLDIIQSIAFSPDGTRIATGGFKAARIWVQTPREQVIATPPLINATHVVAFHPSGTRFAMVNAIGDIEVWERAEPKRLSLTSGYADRITELAWAASPDRLFALDFSGRVLVIDANAGKELARLESDLSAHSLAVSSDGTQVAIIDSDKKVTRFRFEQTTAEAPITIAKIDSPHTGAVAGVTSVAFTMEPNASLVLATEAGTVQWFTLASGEKRHEVNHGAGVTKLAISSDGLRLAAAGVDGRTTLWEAATDKLSGQAVMTFESRVRFAKSLADAQSAVAREEARSAKQAALLTERETFAKNESESLKTVQADRDKLAEALKAEEAKLVETANAVTMHEAMIETAKQAFETVSAQAEVEAKIKDEAKAALDKLTAELAPKVAARDEATKKKDTAAMQLMQKEQTLANAKEATERANAAVPIQARAVAVQTRFTNQAKQIVAQWEAKANAAASPIHSIVMGSRFLVIAFANGIVHVHRLSDGAFCEQFTAPAITTGESCNFAFLDADSLGLFASARKPQRWSLRPQWQWERTIGGSESNLISDRVSGLAFSPDGTCLAIGSGTPSRDGQVQLFAMGDATLLRTFGDVHSDSVLSLQFSPDGKKLASSAADRTIRILDVAIGKVDRMLEGHTHHVLSAAWQSDAVGVVSSSADQTVKVWDSETGSSLRTIPGFPKEVTSVFFVASTRQVITSCADGNIRVHKVDDGGNVRTINASGDFLHCLTATPDGKFIIAGGQSGVLRFWTNEDSKLIREIK